MSARNLITFVCTANVCRSPMAQRLFEHALKREREPLASLKAASAGISAYGGDPVSPNSQRVLESVGLDLSDHVSRRLTEELIDASFAIFCMTSTHKLLVETQFDAKAPHLHLMREFMPDDVEKEIPDPYGLDRAAYEAARDSMVEAIPGIMKFLRDRIIPARAGKNGDRQPRQSATAVENQNF